MRPRALPRGTCVRDDRAVPSVSSPLPRWSRRERGRAAAHGMVARRRAGRRSRTLAAHRWFDEEPIARGPATPEPGLQARLRRWAWRCCGCSRPPTIRLLRVLARAQCLSSASTNAAACCSAPPARVRWKPRWTIASSGLQNAQFTLNFDYTLAPILRRDVPQAEWSKNRLLWARLGFEYGTSGSVGQRFVPVLHRHRRTELALPDRQATLWLTSRLRVDLRDINGESSQRYRVRLGAEWDAVAFDHPYAPYASVETLYDTRYDKWSRVTLKAGVETPIADRLARRALPRAAVEPARRRAQPRARARPDLQGLFRLMGQRVARGYRVRRGVALFGQRALEVGGRAASTRCAPGAWAGRSAAWRPHPPAARPR